MSETADRIDETARLLHDEPELSSEIQSNVSKKTRSRIPARVWLVAILAACESFAYYGVLTPLQNYLQNPSTESSTSGSIGLGQSNASKINLLFIGWCYITPIVGAAVADHSWGKYKTIRNFLILFAFGNALMVYSSMVAADDARAALVIMIAAMIVGGLGAGSIKSTTASWIAEQYPQPDGSEISANEFDTTVQRIYMYFHMIVNIGASSPSLTTQIEHRFGFSFAFGTSLLVLILAIVFLISCKNLFVHKEPQGSILLRVLAVLKYMSHSQGTQDGPANEAASSAGLNAGFIAEAKKVAKVWWLLAIFPFFFLALVQLFTNLVSQAGSMATHGVPNDMMASLDAITLLVMVPILDYLVFSKLKPNSIANRPKPRIVFGFIMMALAMTYAGILQCVIYRFPGQIHIAWQIPVYPLAALSEIFAVTTGLKLAFTQAPESMKSVVMALFQLTVALGAFIGVAMTPLAQDPLLPWLYFSLSLMCFVVAGVFGLFIGRGETFTFQQDDNTIPQDDTST